jgi:hypothetical protein
MKITLEVLKERGADEYSITSFLEYCIEKNKPIEPIYPYEKILACCSTKYKDIVNSKQINNTIKPNKQDIKEIIRLKILEMQQEDSNTSIVAQDGKDINLKKRITRSNSFETRTKSHDLEMFNSR